MFTYVYLGTTDLVRACRFYDATLGALGIARCDVSGESSWEGVCGWGTYQHMASLSWRCGSVGRSTADPPTRGTAQWWHWEQGHGARSMPSILLRCPTVAPPQGLLAFGRSTTRISMPPMCEIRMETS